MNKRGLSTVVSMLIILLLAITAIGVIWSPARDFFRGSEEKISVGDLSIDLEIMSVSLVSYNNSVFMQIKKNMGVEKVNITSLKVVFEDEFSSEDYSLNIQEGFPEVGEKIFFLDLRESKLNMDYLRKVSIIPTYTNEKGKEFISLYIFTYDLEENLILVGPKDPSLFEYYSDVLLVTNLNSPESVAISNYYKETRGITHQLVISTSTEEMTSFVTFNSTIRAPIKEYIMENNLLDKINYVVLTKGIPLRINETITGCRSIDSMLTMMFSRFEYRTENGIGCVGSFGFFNNPMYRGSVSANRTYYDMYVVSRLDGYSVEDVINAMGPSPFHPMDGSFLLDQQISNQNSQFQQYDQNMDYARNFTIRRGFPTILEETTTFATDMDNLMGYYSFGSNDQHVPTANSSAWNLKFNLGSIGDTAVSTSGRTFRPVNSYYSPDVGLEQSLIADLTAGGMSFVKGYVHEPYFRAISHPEYVLERYTRNYTAGESMYMGSRYIMWKDIYLGDPKIKIYLE